MNVNYLHVPQRVILSEMEFLRSVFSTRTIISKTLDVIRFTIHNCHQDELNFEEWRINFGFSMRGLATPRHENGISTYWVRKK